MKMLLTSAKRLITNNFLKKLRNRGNSRLMDDQTIETEQTNRDAMSNKCDPDACDVRWNRRQLTIPVQPWRFLHEPGPLISSGKLSSSSEPERKVTKATLIQYYDDDKQRHKSLSLLYTYCMYIRSTTYK